MTTHCETGGCDNPDCERCMKEEKENTCSCAYEMGYLDWKTKKVVFHLYWCENGEAMKEYNKLNWFQKLFVNHPRY